jgi:hypothetical protein
MVYRLSLDILRSSELASHGSAATALRVKPLEIAVQIPQYR